MKMIWNMKFQSVYVGCSEDPKTMKSRVYVYKYFYLTGNFLLNTCYIYGLTAYFFGNYLKWSSYFWTNCSICLFISSLILAISVVICLVDPCFPSIICLNQWWHLETFLWLRVESLMLLFFFFPYGNHDFFLETMSWVCSICTRIVFSFSLGSIIAARPSCKSMSLVYGVTLNYMFRDYLRVSSCHR